MDTIESVEALDVMDKPAKGKKAAEESANLSGLIASMQSDIDSLKSGKAPANGKSRKRVKDHTARMREYEHDGNPYLVISIGQPKFVKDTTEVRRERGLISLELLDPKTKKKVTAKDVDYIEFLEHVPQVLVKIDKWDREERFEVEAHGMLRSGSNHDQIIDDDHDFEVGYVDHTFTVTVAEGAFSGCKLVVGEASLNK